MNEKAMYAWDKCRWNEATPPGNCGGNDDGMKKLTSIVENARILNYNLSSPQKKVCLKGNFRVKVCRTGYMAQKLNNMKKIQTN
jgi:hypothetical protein